ncbi:MAG: oligopeptide/dipeptide ABC transporter ATP-binding protein [Solirubrobacteraceae bacterium]
MPVPDPRGGTQQRQLLTGDVPSPANQPSACRFHTRCPKAQPKCSEEEPLLAPKPGGTIAACHYPLTDEEVTSRLPVALARQRGAPEPAA